MRKYLSHGALFCAILLLIGMVPTEAPAAPAAPLATGFYKISAAASSGLCLSVPSASTTQGTQLTLAAKSSSTSQMFGLSYSKGVYSIRPACSGLYLDVKGGSTKAGTPVIQWASTGGANQSWTLRKNADNTFSIISAQSALALQPVAGKVSAGTKIDVSNDKGTSAQAWKMTPVTSDSLKPGHVSIISVAVPSRRIDISGGSRAAGAPAILWTDTGGGINQKFLIKALGNDTYRFISLNSGYALAQSGKSIIQSSASSKASLWKASRSYLGRVRLCNVATGNYLTQSGSAKTGYKLGVSTTNTTVGGLFLCQPTTLIKSKSYYTISSKAGTVLDITGSSKSNGAAAILWSSTGGANQKWQLTSTGNGYYRFTCAASSKILDINGGSTKSGAKVQQWSSTGGSNQKWKFSFTPDGYFYIISASGMYLSYNNSGAKGATLRTSATAPGNAGKFRLKMTTYSPPKPKPKPTYVDVNLSTQTLTYYVDGKVALTTPVVTGRPSMPTVQGTFSIYLKSRNTYLTGPGYHTLVSYWMPFYKGYGLHDATWQAKFGGTRYKDGYGSHGCVNMPLDKARDLYGMVSVGTVVKVHK